LARQRTESGTYGERICERPDMRQAKSGKRQMARNCVEFLIRQVAPRRRVSATGDSMVHTSLFAPYSLNCRRESTECGALSATFDRSTTTNAQHTTQDRGNSTLEISRKAHSGKALSRSKGLRIPAFSSKVKPLTGIRSVDIGEHRPSRNHLWRQNHWRRRRRGEAQKAEAAAYQRSEEEAKATNHSDGSGR
jgi:hypothetical protein